ncbi:MAG: hypothetical protein HRT91_03220 [Piscirickettsiaceae bacterium]|nr:hypothetical protein [Piscirickettsiaceae bacterium]
MLSISLITFVMFILFFDWLITPFMNSSNKLLRNLGSKLFIVATFTMPIHTFRNIIFGYFRGWKDSITPMRAS